MGSASIQKVPWLSAWVDVICTHDRRDCLRVLDDFVDREFGWVEAEVGLNVRSDALCFEQASLGHIGIYLRELAAPLVRCEGVPLHRTKSIPGSPFACGQFQLPAG